LHPRYELIGTQLHDALVQRCHFWRHLRALSGFYFMQQGESMHRICDMLFERVCWQSNCELYPNDVY
jgi:hypothetical protein